MIFAQCELLKRVHYGQCMSNEVRYSGVFEYNATGQSCMHTFSHTHAQSKCTAAQLCMLDVQSKQHPACAPTCHVLLAHVFFFKCMKGAWVIALQTWQLVATYVYGPSVICWSCWTADKLTPLSVRFQLINDCRLNRALFFPDYQGHHQ